MPQNNFIFNLMQIEPARFLLFKPLYHLTANAFNTALWIRRRQIGTFWLVVSKKIIFTISRNCEEMNRICDAVVRLVSIAE